MAVKIRMKRVGAKNSPYFRIVVADSRSPRDGKCIEEIGTYQPLKQGDNFTLKLDRAQHWISKGAQPSDTVASFIKKAAKAAAKAAQPPAEPRQKRKKANGDKPGLKFDLQTILAAASELNADDYPLFEKMINLLDEAGKPGRERLLAAIQKVFA